MATTVSNRTEKLNVYTNTIRNWAEFLPTIQPVLFTTFESGPLIDIAKQYGWHVYPAPEVNPYGIPVLKSLFQSEYKYYKGAYLFGFANGDMLFDDGLLKTIKLMYQHNEKLGTGVMHGVRFNYNMSLGGTTKPLWQISTVRMLAESRTLTQLFRPLYFDAADYLFVTADYPFQKIKPVVIGRPNYESYFIAKTNQWHLMTLHATFSIGAVHQTDEDGNMAGIDTVNDEADQQYNNKLIGNEFKRTSYPAHAQSAKYHSAKQANGAITLTCPRKCKPQIVLT